MDTRERDQNVYHSDYNVVIKVSTLCLYLFFVSPLMRVHR